MLDLKGFFKAINSIAPLFASIGVVAGIVWWAAWITIGYEDLQQEIFELKLKFGDFEPAAIDSKLSDLKFDVDFRSSGLKSSSLDNEVKGLRERTAALSTRLAAIEREQSSREQSSVEFRERIVNLSTRLVTIESEQASNNAKHDHFTGSLASLFERTSLLLSGQAKE